MALEDNISAQYGLQSVAAADSMGILEQVGHGAVAAVVDAGVSIFNSIPGTEEANTSDLLSRIDENAMQVYNEHPEAVRAASFIIGSAAPIGLSTKIMAGLRAGSKGVSWFNEAGRVSRLAEAEAAFASGLGEAANYKKVRNLYYATKATNTLTDVAAAEVAINITMNAHPWMEDYQKDLAKNFAFNLALGGALGVGLGHIIARKEITAMTMGVEKEWTSLLSTSMKAVDPAENAGTNFLTRTQNIDNLKGHLDSIEEGTLKVTNQTKEVLTVMHRVESEKLVTDFTQAASEEIGKLLPEQRDAIIKTISSPEFSGMDKIKFLEVTDSVLLPTVETPGILKSSFDFIAEKVMPKTGEVKTVAVDGAYSQAFKSFMGIKEAGNYATLADAGKSLEQLEKIAAKEYKIGAVPRSDIAVEMEIENTAKLQEDKAVAFLKFHEKTVKELEKMQLVSSPEDFATLMAINSRISTLKGLGEDVSKIKVLLTTNAPSFHALEKVMLSRAGIDASYLKNLRSIGGEKEWEQFSLFHPYKEGFGKGLSSRTEEIISKWIDGTQEGYRTLREGGLSLRAGTTIPQQTGRAAIGVKALTEIMDHPKSVALRDTMRTMADPEGYVYLYRGLKAEPLGHRGLESFTILPEKAAEFGKVSLFKVHVDDIVGGMHDIGAGSKKPEILVLNPTREFTEVKDFHKVPEELMMETSSNINKTLKSGTIEMAGEDLSTHIGAELNKSIATLRKQGVSDQSIALRTGVPLDTLQNAPHVIEQGVGITHFDSITRIEEALRTENRTLQLSTNINKYRAPNVYTALNKMNIDSMSQGLVDMNVLSSPSAFVREIGAKITGDEFTTQQRFLIKHIEDVVGSGLGNTWMRSANSVVEKLGVFGNLATAIGKQTIDLKNIAKEKFTKPLSLSLASLAENDLHRIELNTALNVASSISGGKIFKAGQFWEFGATKLKFEELAKLSDSDFLLHAREVSDKSGLSMLNASKFAGKEYKVVQPEVQKVLSDIQNAGRELYHLKNTKNSIVGNNSLVDIGFWHPANNPAGKEIAYVFNKNDQTTSMIMANTVDELLQGIKDFKGTLGTNALAFDIITKDQQYYYNILAGRHDPMYMGIADASKKHGGASATASVDTSTRLLADLIQGYDHYIDKGVEDLIKLQLSPITQHLDNLSVLSQYGHGGEQAVGKMVAAKNAPVDPGEVIKNILLGKSNLDQHAGWVKFQNGFQVIADTGLRAIADIASPLIKKGTRTTEEWVGLSKEMEARGIVNPFQTMEKFINANGLTEEKYFANVEAGAKTFVDQAGITREALSPRFIALSNSIAATTTLRVADLAQPLVNILSLPILTAGATSRNLEKSFMGATLDPNAKFNVASAMMDGVRLSNHPTMGEHYLNLGKAEHIFKQDWRDVNGIIQHVRKLDPSLTSRAEEVLDSHLVSLLSKPADWSEGFVRKQAFFTGVAMAKKAYPQLGDAGVMTFARNFMDEAIGNYAAAQRPAMFQGTVGMAMGLFQTYMLTMGQLLYKGVEQKNWKMLSSMLLTQQGVFGTASLPGFHPISDAIGTHFSDNHYDLQTGTFRAIGDPMASLVLYGLPSQLVGINTRGDIQPRVPNPLNAMNSIATINMAKQAYDAADRVISAAASADGNTGKAMLEALSLQSLSRPVARLAELATGHAITSKGNIIDRDTVFHDGAIDSLGILSRVMATRPIAEIKAREAQHLNTMYGAYDRDRTQALTIKLKSYVTNGELTDGKLEELGSEYMRRGGTPTGWRSSVNTAIMQTGQNGATTITNTFKPNRPFQLMVSDLD